MIAKAMLVIVSLIITLWGIIMIYLAWKEKHKQAKIIGYICGLFFVIGPLVLVILLISFINL